MAESIKEKIIAAIYTRAQLITGGAYNTTFSTFLRGYPRAANADLPALFVFPQAFERTDQTYPLNYFELPITILGISEFGAASPDSIAIQMESDFMECFFGTVYTIAYTSGNATDGTPVGKTATHIASGKTIMIQSGQPTAGSWAAGNAAGEMRIIRPQALSPLIGAFTFSDGGFSSSTPVISERNLLSDIFGSLDVKELLYTGSGVESYPGADDTVVTARLDMKISYKIKQGNPYAQP
jgi:hypothetical protein